MATGRRAQEQAFRARAVLAVFEALLPFGAFQGNETPGKKMDVWMDCWRGGPEHIATAKYQKHMVGAMTPVGGTEMLLSTS
eukprot:42713-Eustigmatos_ZCMA.PRE.1